MSNQQKSQQLRMSFGKAGAILRKNIIFHLAEKCGMKKCYHCGKLIDNIDNFSIEHKKPWLHEENAVDLFFDMNNIAFSHLKCNSSAARKPKQLKSVSKYGYKGIAANGNLFQAFFTHNKQKMYIGTYKTAKEAAIAYDEKIVEVLGENAITNKSLGLL